MTQDQFNNERDYCALIALVGAMLGQGAIDERGFAILRRKLLEQYRPVTSCLQAEKPP